MSISAKDFYAEATKRKVLLQFNEDSLQPCMICRNNYILWHTPSGKVNTNHYNIKIEIQMPEQRLEFKVQLGFQALIWIITSRSVSIMKSWDGIQV